MNLPSRLVLFSSEPFSVGGDSVGFGMASALYPIRRARHAPRKYSVSQLGSKRTSAPPLRFTVRLAGFPFTWTFAPPDRSASRDSEAATSACAPPLPLIITEPVGTSHYFTSAPPAMDILRLFPLPA